MNRKYNNDDVPRGSPRETITTVYNCKYLHFDENKTDRQTMHTYVQHDTITQ